MKIFKSWKFWVIFSVAVLVLTALTVFLIWYIPLTAKIDTPTNLKCIKTSTNEIYLEVAENERAEFYVFTITNGNNTQTLKVKDNVVSVTGYLSLSGEFVISCQYVGKVESASSDFCEPITYTSQTRISTPSVQLDAGMKRFFFSITQNFSNELSLVPALVYGITQDGEYISTTQHAVVLSDNKRGAMSGYFELDFLPSGEYSLGVKILVENEIYISSLLSEQIYFNQE